MKFKQTMLLSVAMFSCLGVGRAELVSHWPLDGDAGDVVGDHDGEASGGVVFGAKGAAAHTGTAAKFNGSTSTITVPHSTELNPESFTLALWAKSSGGAGAWNSPVTSRHDLNPDSRGYLIYDSQPSGVWTFWSGNGTRSGNWQTLDGPKVKLGQWQHIAITYDNATETKKLYIDGKLRVQQNELVAPNDKTPFNIGSGSDYGTTYHFEGLIDDVAVWNNALTSREIRNVMNNGVPRGAPAVVGFSASPPLIRSGQTVTLSWEVLRADSVSITPGVGSVTGASGQVVVSPDATTTYTLTAVGDSTPNATAQLTVGVDVEAMPLVLSEFVADNQNGLTDADGDPEDWIEIHNPNPFAIELEGWSLTDNPLRPDKWKFPTRNIRAGEYLIVFASKKSGALDTSFRLARAGEYLALISPEDEVVSEFAPAYPAQFSGVSYGTPAGGGPPAFLNPTPGVANGPALTEIPPAVTDVTENPPQPTAQTPLKINATVTPRAGAVDSVKLTYRVGFGTERTIAMSHNGVGIYSATIPASAYSAGDMVRWYVTARSSGGKTTREPPFPNATESAEYLGTVVANPGIETNLPLLHWFTADTANADRRRGTRASLFFNGRFYDNIFCRIRGQSTANWPKHKYKFDFYRGGHFSWKEGAPAVEEFNVNSHFRDGYLRENAIFAFLNQAGSPAPETMYLWIKRNGGDMGLFSFVEQVDEEFLGRHGFDGSGSLYKAINVPATLSPTVNTGLYRKLLRRDEPYTDLIDLTANINIANPDRFAYVADEVNLPNYINVMAAMAVPGNHDQLTKNYYLYRDPHRQEWFRMPWDGDAALHNRSHENWTSPLYGDAKHTQELRNNAPNPVWQNHLHSAILDNPVTREMYMRRVRTLADRYLAIPPEQPATVIIPGEAGAASAFYHVPKDGSLDATWHRPEFDPVAAGWTKGRLGLGYENSAADYADLISTRVKPSETAANARSIYTRMKFDVADPAAIAGLVLQMKFDDGFVAYLNGTEVTRANVNGTARFDSAASSNHPDSHAAKFEEFILPLTPLVAGANVLAIHAVNQSANSSDMLLLPQLLNRAGGGGYFENLLNGFAAQISADAARDQRLWAAEGITSFKSTLSSILNGTLPTRRTQLFETYGPSGSGLIPESEPANPVVSFGSVEFNPDSGKQDEEFIEIINTNAYAVDLSGWRVEGGVDLTFPPGAVIPAAGADPERGKLFLTPDVAAFRGRASSPTGGESRLVIGNYSGHLSNAGEQLTLYDANRRPVSTTTTPAKLSDAQQFLIVSEIMYHPSDQSGGSEFIEVMNTSDSVTLGLGGMRFTRGIQFGFAPGTRLKPGGRLVIAQSQFENGTALGNGGETIKIEDANNSTVAEFAYDDAAPWPTAPDGGGPSLVLIQPGTRPDPNIAAHWRSSAFSGGSPGNADAIPYGGGDPIAHAIVGSPRIIPAGDGTLLYSYTRQAGAESVRLTVEWSENLVTWETADRAGATSVADFEAGTVREFLPFPLGNRRFARLKATVIPGHQP
ncbi:MAG: CotH kinase family protein [Verrucomicrobiota bacterium]|nr:CotH kinase family protein [Verrucomicrobiota bacterium]